MSRVPPLDPATLTAEQQRVAAAISGARKNVRGPFTIWLRNPALAEHANAFGVALRDSSKLDRRLFELAVITVCRAWSVQYAWSSHAPAAEAAGVSPDVVAAIRDNRKPELKRDDERVVYDVATELMQTKELSQATYDRAIAQFGIEGTVDLVSTVGYYAMVGIFLKSFDVPTPAGDRPLK
ncbi:MAG: carboxymuconolactone decarboxylase family protein [Tardiphaga sp.]|jgi:4-carboxymuconolactone decarboxylase